MTNQDEPKIIVDEDWKSQVEREKEALRNQATAAGQTDNKDATADTADSEPAVDSKKASAPSADRQLPPATFNVLVSTLATQAMAAMGLFPDPETGQPQIERPLAKHFIDTLVMLEEKSKGNLTDDEAAQLRDGLHQLRMIYLALPPLSKTPSPAAAPEPKKSKIELP